MQADNEMIKVHKTMKGERRTARNGIDTSYKEDQLIQAQKASIQAAHTTLRRDIIGQFLERRASTV